ncbi:unnamed protein product [Caenorhabditis auriculariae]|uniref:Beta-1,4-N-acetylgalactosaminyltransferase n=1 Tax=Caenorhabditis auriculariae TaxID=2777116 RepID=A0A8S1GTV7_9PELO|nr:unnamed protein product [Caenorhabditis auriculariae]
MQSRIRVAGALICSLAAVHLLIFEMPSFYDNYVVRSSSFSFNDDDDDVMAQVLTDSANLDPNWSTSTTRQFSKAQNASLGSLELLSYLEATNMTFCPLTPPSLVGPIRVFLDEPQLNVLAKMFKHIERGGHGKPTNCLARHKVAIIVPYRDRESQLRILLHNLHTLLEKQQMEYGIFIIEQVADQTFNRGKLMNVGYAEASKMFPWQCYIFHDVDLLPEDDRNLYSCPVQPRHMSVAIDKFNYRLPYSSIFGGISALRDDQVKAINGFSNSFWGWGGEDDDLSQRTSRAGFKVSRYPGEIARYKMVKHSREDTNSANKCRWKLLKKTGIRWRHDGLNDLKYRVLSIEQQPLFTRILVDLLEQESKKALRKFFPDC